MADGAATASPEATKEALADVRNRELARQRTDELKSSISDAGTISNIPTERGQIGEGTQTRSDNPTGYVGYQAGGGQSPRIPETSGTTSQAQSPETAQPAPGAALPSNPAQQAEQLNGARQQSRKGREQTDAEQTEESGPSPASRKSPTQEQIDREYPKPVPLMIWIVLLAVAVLCDVVTLVLALTGVGELLGWVIGCIPMAMYYPLYWFRFPKNPMMKRALNIRTIINYAVELVPYLGSVWVGNSLVVIYAYVVIRKFERGGFSSLAAGALSQSSSTSSAGAKTLPR